MTVNQPPDGVEDIPPISHASHVANALRTLNTFTREQVAWLMQTAMRWGYENRDTEDRGFWAGYWTRVAEENSRWPDDTVLFRHNDVIRSINQRAYRTEWDEAARLPRIGDHPGGPVKVWGCEDEDRAAA